MNSLPKLIFINIIYIFISLLLLSFISYFGIFLENNYYKSAECVVNNIIINKECNIYCSFFVNYTLIDTSITKKELISIEINNFDNWTIDNIVPCYYDIRNIANTLTINTISITTGISLTILISIIICISIILLIFLILNYNKKNTQADLSFVLN